MIRPGSGCLIVFLLYEKIGLTFSCYVAVPVVAPIALCGFYSYNGMGFQKRAAVKKAKEERKRMHKESVGSRLKKDKVRCAKNRKEKRKKKYMKTNS